MATQPTVQNLIDPRYTDVVLSERVEGAQYVSRETVTLTNATGGTFKQGTVLWRVKAADSTGVWDVVDAAGDIVLANEFAVLIGDGFEPKETVTVAAATATPVLAIVRDARVKEKVLKDVAVTGFSVSEANFANLKRLMAKDTILVEGSLTAIAP